MLGYFNDFDRNLALKDQLRRRMDRVFDEMDGRPSAAVARDHFPLANLYDTGKTFVLSVEVPGLTDKDVNITLTQDVLTLSGERKADAPEGYSVHRRERLPVKFSRSVALPARVDPDKAVAQVKDGVLTITLEKATEVQPRQISVRAN
jgi:HSP20 family protein